MRDGRCLAEFWPWWPWAWECLPLDAAEVCATRLSVVSLIMHAYPLPHAANPPPRTLSPEYQRAQEEYMRSQNCNPIFGISSKKANLAEESVHI